MIHFLGANIVIVLSLFYIFSAVAETKDRNDFLVGGACEYKTYQGQAKITSISPKKGNGPEPVEYEIKFLFYPERKITESYARIEGKEFSLLLNNAEAPRKTLIQKYDLKVGGVFHCTLKVIVKGSCTPLLFEFPFTEEVQEK